jgi:Family of unknown function (DUF5906)
MAEDDSGLDPPEGSDRGDGSNVVDFAMAAKRALAERRKKLDNALENLIDKFNSRYAVVNANGAVLVFEQKPDPLRLGCWLLHKYTFADFIKLHQNRQVRLIVKTPTVKDPDGLKEITGNAAKIWLSHPRRLTYDEGLCFDPTKSVSRGWFNLWTGYGCAPRRGSWRLMQAHVLQIICSNNQEYYKYLLDVAALMIQQPAAPAEVCCVLQGEEGVGKGIFLHALRRLMGQHGLYLSHPEQLRSKYNAHLWDCVMLFADEAFYAGDKQHEGLLKSLITEEYLLVEPKFRDVFSALNHLHIWMSSNAKWVVPVGLHGRRWFVLKVADNRRGDHEYFKSLTQEMDNGGREAMLHDLLRRDLSGFNPRIVPETAAYLEQRLHTLDTLHRWWLEVLEREFVWRSRWGLGCFRRWDQFYTTELLASSYTQFCDDHHLFQRQSRAELQEMMGEMYRATQPRGRPSDLRGRGAAARGRL